MDSSVTSKKLNSIGPWLLFVLLLFDSVLLFGSYFVLFFVDTAAAVVVLDAGFVNAEAAARLLSCC